MRNILIGMLVLLLGVTGCSQNKLEIDPELIAFIDVLKEQGVDGDLTLRAPLNDDMVYLAEYTIAKYTSTRILSIIKCKDEQKAEAHLQDALKNSKLAGQSRNGRYLLVATFYPEENEAVGKIKELFLAHKFKQ